MSDQESIGDEEMQLMQEENTIKELLKHTSYETLLKLRKEDNQISSFSKKIKKEKVSFKTGTKEKKGDSKASKSSKGKPKERDARIPVSRFQNIMEIKKPQGRDPRFDGMSGTLNQELFEKSYGFLAAQKEQEIATLKKEINSANKKKYSDEEVKKLRGALGQNKDEMNRFKKNEEIRSIKRAHKHKMNDRIKHGKGTFFMKKSELKDKILEKKFNELESKKKLKKTMEQKKMKQSQKMYREFKKIQHKTQAKNRE